MHINRTNQIQPVLQMQHDAKFSVFDFLIHLHVDTFAQFINF